MFIVYKTTNLINGRIYVGVHNCSNDKYLGSGTALSLAIEKYGKDNFKRETLFEFMTLEEALTKEAEIVNEDFVNDSTTYNLTVGGGMPPVMYGNTYKLGVKESEETKARKKEAFAKSDKHAAHLKNVGLETRKKRSEIAKTRMAAGWNPMNDLESRKRLAETKIGLKKLTKDGVAKMAKPGSVKWNDLIEKGFS